MLKTGGKTEDDKGYAYDKITEQKTADTGSEPWKHSRKNSHWRKISIEGNIRGDENLVIEGSMKGKIEMGKA